MLKLSKKIALPLIAVLLIGTGVGGYFLFRNFQLPKYSVDRYPELLEYCDIEEGEDSLMVSCKALMLDIKPNASDGTPSLTSLIITKGEELREYTITEEEGKFVFTNDILQFKKLKPIVINIQYTKINPIKYAVQNITFEDIPETYIQEIVNRDIEEIMGMDKSSTTILNSFDFCPRPEILPDYVIKKEEYAKYWSENILPESEYLNGYNYSLDDTTIRLLFACDSARNIGYSGVCSASNNIENSLNVFSSSDILAPNFEKELDTNDRMVIKMLSLISDRYNRAEGLPSFSDSYFSTWFSGHLNMQAQKEQVFCSLQKVIKNNKSSDAEDFEASKSSSTLCLGQFDLGKTNQAGIYLKYRFIDNMEFYIFDRCNNLRFFFE